MIMGRPLSAALAPLSVFNCGDTFHLALGWKTGLETDNMTLERQHSLPSGKTSTLSNQSAAEDCRTRARHEEMHLFQGRVAFLQLKYLQKNHTQSGAREQQDKRMTDSVPPHFNRRGATAAVLYCVYGIVSYDTILGSQTWLPPGVKLSNKNYPNVTQVRTLIQGLSVLQNIV